MIVAVDSQPVAQVDDVLRLLVGDRIGKTIELDVLRGGRRVALRLVPVELEL
jgi:S1-C subfamily serine protease